MSFWSWWSRRPADAEPDRIEPERRPTFTEADREFVRSALDRFEAHGLTIWSKLNRELIVARALIDAERWKRDGDRSDDDLSLLFFVLAAETDSLTFYVDEVEELFPSLHAMDDDAANAILGDHSDSIFVNARSICTVNEDNSLNNMVYELSGLSSLDVSGVSQTVMKNGLTRISFQAEGIGECHFAVESQKRPDIGPALAEMNRIAKSKDIGQYIMVSEGSSESMIFIFAPENVLPEIASWLEVPGFSSSDTVQTDRPNPTAS
jgi:hypothetical protein